MKVLLTGATGTIGGAILRYCLEHPAITSVVAITRRPLESESPKCSNIIIHDFKNWNKSIMDRVADADAMIWALGNHTADREVNYNYAVTFQEAMRRAMPSERSARFRFILISGALVEPDQEKSLYFLEAARKTKGLTETWCLDFSEANKSVWQTWIVKPGGVYAPGSFNSYLACLLPPPLGSIGEHQLGAFTADLVVEGTENEGRVSNGRMVARGDEILKTL
ncbi:hypothetical protein P280DRAFT_501555 [Massarina eburnea CBS 473.64]|uniref:NAD(P)-binding domain-containing protein n=1 Tax=Massarina eburnea CBS 473.64 TaxID=1395130 RepID=A0A6A6RQA5_9PLEO|nr:hypothetical protein P280DRAFT_501555 [Massarina eburnea CBS 473.64]